MDQPYDNSGVLFVNDKKEKENQPDYTGNITMNGTKMRLAGWKKTAKKDPSKQFLSISVSEFQGKQEPAMAENEDLKIIGFLPKQNKYQHSFVKYILTWWLILESEVQSRYYKEPVMVRTHIL